MLRYAFILQVNFEPSLRAVRSLVANTLHDIVDCIVSIPRLVEKFKVTSNNMQALWAIVEEDDECKQLQDLIMQGKDSFVIIDLRIQHC
jgi:hypothetical protein